MNDEIHLEDDVVEAVGPVEFGNRLQKLIDGGVLVIEQRALPALTTAVAVCMRDNCLNILIEKLERMCMNKRDRITLYADGMPAEMSFGILWHERPALWERDGEKYYGEPRADARAFMVGGLIYRGPMRGYNHQHEWTSHT